MWLLHRDAFCSRQRSRGFTLVELLVVIAIIGVLVALLLPAVQTAREAARRMKCINNMKQLALAAHNYHDVHTVFPPGWITPRTAPTNTNYWGWVAVILPFVEQKGLYDAVGVGVLDHIPPVTSQPLLQSPVAVYQCPSDASPKVNPFYQLPRDVGLARNNYMSTRFVMWGPGEDIPTRMAIISDGTSNTFMLGERHTSVAGGKFVNGGNMWGRVQFGINSDAPFIFHAGWSINVPNEMQATNGTPDVWCKRMAITSNHPGGANFAFCDASARFISQNIATNPRCAKQFNGCINGSATRSGGVPAGTCAGVPGATYQNLYDAEDGTAVSIDF
jgi:prepilin-type N-terminal cleavage/methylation domain-containing protein/prepilin-type processing-associated H-X9-DG protein